ncbi:hypothetical protein BGZ82_007147 [Podila clonocystis]|nr:hypothetical protein BGZ82_007147 [Podila clonocystis]
MALFTQVLITFTYASTIRVHPEDSSSVSSPSSSLTKRWHPEPPPILQKPCLAVDRVHGRTYMIGYDSHDTLTFNFINSSETCVSKKDEDDFDWRHAQWISLPYPGGEHAGRRFDTDQCFLSSDNQFVVPTFEADGEGGFSLWNHGEREWRHARISAPCSCHEESYEEGSKIKVKKDAKHVKFEYPNRQTVVYQSLRTNVACRTGASVLESDERCDEAIDTVVIHWKDADERDHLTGVQLVNSQVNSCHDIKLGRDVLPKDLTLIASPNNPYHYTYKNSPQKLHHHGDHTSRCENTTLFLFGPEGSGWFDIEIADRPSTRPVDILFMRPGAGKGGFHGMSSLTVKHPRAVYYRERLWIFGKNDQGVGVWSIDTASLGNSYEFTAQSQGANSPGGLACASCGTGIIVYGGCDSAEGCSTNLRPGEQGDLGGKEAPVSIYRPGNDEEDDDDDDDDNDDEDEGDHENENDENNVEYEGGKESGSQGGSNGGSSGGSHGVGGTGSHRDSGSHGGSDSHGGGDSHSGGSENGSQGSGGSNDNSSGGGSGSEGGNSGGQGGNSGIGQGSTGGGAGQGSSGSWSPASGVPAGTVPEGVPGAVVPGATIPGATVPGAVPGTIPGVVVPNPFPNPDVSASVPVLMQGTPTGTVITTPTNAGIPDNSKATGDDNQVHKKTGAIIGGLFGAVAVIALVALIFVLARRRRRNNETMAEEVGPAGPDDGEIGGASSEGPSGVFAPGGPDSQSKYTAPGSSIAIPPLAPISGSPGGPSDSPAAPGGPSESTGIPAGPSGSGYPGLSGPAIGAGIAAGGAILAAGVIVNKDKHKESKATDNEQVFGAGHTVHENSSSESENNILPAKRSSKAKFFMGGGDYKVPVRRTSPGLPAGPSGSEAETSPSGPSGVIPVGSRPDSDDVETVEVVPKEERNHTIVSEPTTTSSSKVTNGSFITGVSGIVLGAGVVAAAQHTSSSSHGDQNGRKPIFIGGDKEEVLIDSERSSETDLHLIGHGRNESSSSSGTAMVIGDDGTTIMQHSGSTSTTSVVMGHSNSSTTRILTDSNKSTVLKGTTVSGERTVAGMVLVGQQKVVVQRPPPTIQKTQITLKLSIIRYERSDASQATPLAKPGTLMFSQVEMIESAPEINISGSAFSHVRDSSKVTGQEEGLPSPVVPGPSGAVSSSESEPRERCLRWMKNEFQWKREAGMLQHLRSDLYIAELFTLYSLPTFAEYRFASVMGPFSRTLETYIKERKGLQPTHSSALLANPQGPLTLPELKSLTDSISSAIKWCHDHHVVHLSLSPASIFLQEMYSEPDGQGGYRTSVYSSYSNKSIGADNAAVQVEHRWKLWNFNHARFVGEAVDLSMDTTPYTSPEILVASRRFHQKSSQRIIQAEGGEHNASSTTTTTSRSADGVVTKTMTTKSSSGPISAQASGEPEKLMAATTMDIWSLGQIVYELHTGQAMFTSDDDALEKLTSALEKRGGINGSSSSSSVGSSTGSGSNEADNDDEDDDHDLDKAKAHGKIRRQLQHQIAKIESIPVHGAREVIMGLLEMRQERRLDHEEIRTLYLDLQE